MPAEVDIINVALRKVGATPITSRSSGTKTANAADDLYDEVRDALLRSHPWNFATKRVKLARIVTTPVYEYDYGYALPSDWMRTIQVSDNDQGVSSITHTMEIVASARAVLCNAEDVYLRYVSRVSDPNLMAADFRYALATWLAKDLAVPIASSNSLHEALAFELKVAIAKASSSDAAGAPAERRPRGSWANSRSGNQFGTGIWPR